MYCLVQLALAETVKVDDVRSLRAALDKARVNKRITRIELAAGTYALCARIVVDETLPRTAATPFVLAGATGARPVLTGAENLASLHWEAWNGGIWRAKLEDKDFQRLWLGPSPLRRFLSRQLPQCRKKGCQPHGAGAHTTDGLEQLEFFATTINAGGQHQAHQYQ